MSKVDDALEQLRRAAGTLGLSALEDKRAARSLDKVLNRMQRREYERFTFDGNVFDLPDRVQELICELEFYSSLGKTWAKVLGALGVLDEPRIVDLCPGYAPKIELGLFYLGYAGEVLLVNKDARAFAQHHKFLALFAPRFRVETSARDVWSEEVGAHRIVAANHVLDDLVVDHYAARLGIAADDIYEKEGCLIEVWDHILARRDQHREEMTARIAAVLRRVVAPGGKLAVAQYSSYIERVLDLSRVTAFNVELLHEVRDALIAGGQFLDRTALAAHALSSALGPDEAPQHFGPGECIVVEKVRP
jgi:hypothetical protein